MDRFRHALFPRRWPRGEPLTPPSPRERGEGEHRRCRDTTCSADWSECTGLATVSHRLPKRASPASVKRRAKLVRIRKPFGYDEQFRALLLFGCSMELRKAVFQWGTSARGGTMDFRTFARLFALAALAAVALSVNAQAQLDPDVCGMGQIQTRACPRGKTCAPRQSCETCLRTVELFCDPLNLALGEHCFGPLDCASGYCDRGDGTSKTGLCMPRSRAGKINDLCSNNNQCASGRCGGLHQDLFGAWQPGHCSITTSGLGAFCSVNSDCASTYCDRGDGTSKTSMCMPRGGTGKANDPCSNDNQCTSGQCSGLHQDLSGAWQPGRCTATRRLGQFCTGNSDCTSTYCDRGDGTSKTSLCMPRGGAGKTNDPCSNHNQCSNGMCVGLRAVNGSWQPGKCN